MDWKAVAEKIIQDDQNKWEQTYLAEELEVTKVGIGVWPFSDHAMGQFCQKLDIPVRYFRRLPDEMKMTVASPPKTSTIGRYLSSSAANGKRNRVLGLPEPIGAKGMSPSPSSDAKPGFGGLGRSR